MGINSYLIWIDSDIYSLENLMNKISLKISFDIKKLECFPSVERGIERIKEIKFKKIIIMVRGSMIRDLISAIKVEEKKFCCLFEIIVFTRHKEEVKRICKTDEVISSSEYIFNDSNIFEDIKGIINYIGRDEKLTPEQKETFDIAGKFIKIDNYKQIIHPLYYNNCIEPISKEEISDFNQHLISCYDNDIKNIINQLESKQKILNEIICKYWVGAYTLESNFYKKMNERLREKKGKSFIPFIKMMYEGIKKEVFIPEDHQILYRGSLITNFELNKIKNYIKNNNNNRYFPNCIFYIRPFLSFSKNLNKAKSFMNWGSLPKDCQRVLFILNNDQNERNKDLISYASIKKYSFFPKEEEVLFFPYSSFAVKEIKDLRNHVLIYLEYLGKYKENIENHYSAHEIFDDIPNTEFEREISELGLICKNYKKLWEVRKEIKINEGNVTCLLYFGKGKLLFAVYNLIKFYDYINDKNIQNIYEHIDDIIDLYKINERQFVSSSKDKTIKFFEYSLNSFNLIKSLEIHKAQVNQVIKLKLSDKFLSCSNDGEIKCWKFDCNKKIYSDDYILNCDKDNIAIYIYEVKESNIISLSKLGGLYIYKKENNVDKITIIKDIIYPLKNCFSIFDGNKNIIIVGTKMNIFLVDIKKEIIIEKFSQKYKASSITYLNGNLLFGFQKYNSCILREF